MQFKYTKGDVKLDIWENALWFTLFSISFSVSDIEAPASLLKNSTLHVNHSRSKKNVSKKHIEFMNNLAYVIPCEKYRKLFKYTINSIPLTLEIVKDKYLFSKWMYTIMTLIHTTLNMKFVYNYKQLEQYFLEGTGLHTDHWGCFLWRLMHAISFGYTEKYKANYSLFFKHLKYIIICMYCRNSYRRFIREPTTLFNDNVVQSKEQLTHWLYDLHNKVNKKLNKNVNLTYKEVCNFYTPYCC